jgi:hypothetical protein
MRSEMSELGIEVIMIHRWSIGSFVVSINNANNVAHRLFSRIGMDLEPNDFDRGSEQRIESLGIHNEFNFCFELRLQLNRH